MRNREIKYWGLRTLNIIIVTYFDVLLCFWEWIHRFSRFFWLLLFDSCQSLHIIRSKRQHRNTAGSPDLVYSKAVFCPYLITIMIFSVRRPQYFISHTKSQRLLVTRHRLPCEKVNLHITLVKWVWEPVVTLNSMWSAQLLPPWNLSCFSLMRRRRGFLLEAHYHAVL